MIFRSKPYGSPFLINGKFCFQANINGSINAEQVYKSSTVNGDFSANRVTEELRIGFSFNGGRSKSVYEFEDDNGVFSKTHNPQ